MKIGFVTFHVEDLEKAIAFWRDVMGFSLARRFKAGPGMEIAFLADAAGQQLEFIAGGGQKACAGASVGFDVDDIGAALAHLQEHDARITFGPKTLPSGVTLLQAVDPNGVGITFVQGGH